MPSATGEHDRTDCCGNDDGGGDDVRDAVASFEIEDGVGLAEVEVRSERHDEVRDGLCCDQGEARQQGSANERDPGRRSSRSNPSPSALRPASLLLEQPFVQGFLLRARMAAAYRHALGSLCPRGRP